MLYVMLIITLDLLYYLYLLFNTTIDITMSILLLISNINIILHKITLNDA